MNGTTYGVNPKIIPCMERSARKKVCRGYDFGFFFDILAIRTRLRPSASSEIARGIIWSENETDKRTTRNLVAEKLARASRLLSTEIL